MNHMPPTHNNPSLEACPECGKPIPSNAAECPGCGNPADHAAPSEPGKGKRRLVVGFGEFAREGMSKNTSLGRKIWIWFCLIVLVLFALSKIIGLSQRVSGS